MKTKTTTATDPGRFSLSWAREAGLLDELSGQVAAKLRRRSRLRKRVAAAGTVGALLLAVGFWGVPLVRDTGAVETAAAQRQTLTLTDGSTAELNARTELRTDFRYGRRHVFLRQGEAFFSVARDATKPFVVETPAGSIKVTGTAFNVRLVPEGRAEITLLEGGVIFEGGGPAGGVVELRPGEQLDSALPEARRLNPSEIAAATAWRRGQLVLDALQLRETAERLAAFHGISIAVDPRVAGLRPGGTYPMDDLSAFFAGLEEVLPVRVVTRAPGYYAIVPKSD